MIKFNQKGQVSNIVLAIALFIALIGAVLFVVELMAAFKGETVDSVKIVIGIVLVGIGISLETAYLKSSS